MKGKKICLVLLLLSLLCMALPWGVIMEFSPDGEGSILRYYSYFALIVLGYGNWFPLLTGIVSLLMLALCGWRWGRPAVRNGWIVLAALSLAAFCTSGFTALSGGILFLHLVGLAIVLWTYRKADMPW